MEITTKLLTIIASILGSALIALNFLPDKHKKRAETEKLKAETEYIREQTRRLKLETDRLERQPPS